MECIDSIEQIMSFYNRLISLSNHSSKEKSYIRYLFKGYIKNNNSCEEDAHRADIAFRRLPRHDIIIQIIKYALIESYKLPESKKIASFDELRKRFEEDKRLSQDCPLDGVINDVINKLQNTLLFDSLLDSFIKCAMELSYEYDPNFRPNNKDMKDLIDCLTPTGKSNIEYKKKVSFLEPLINPSRYDVLTKKQLKVRRREYSLGRHLRAVIAKKQDYKSNDRGTVLLRHPDDRQFLLLAMAQSKTAMIDYSNYSLTYLTHWFERLDSGYSSNAQEMEKLLEYAIQRAKINSKRICCSSLQLGVAVVCDAQTVINTSKGIKTVTRGDKKVYNSFTRCAKSIDNDSYDFLLLSGNDESSLFSESLSDTSTAAVEISKKAKKRNTA